jgi:hypothetical protein
MTYRSGAETRTPDAKGAPLGLWQSRQLQFVRSHTHSGPHHIRTPENGSVVLLSPSSA